MQREVERLQRRLAARDSLIQQLKAARAADTPARQVQRLLGCLFVCRSGGVPCVCMPQLLRCTHVTSPPPSWRFSPPSQQVSQAMELVGSLAEDLAGTPGTGFLQRHRSASQRDEAGPSQQPGPAAAAAQAIATAGKQARDKQQAAGGKKKAGKAAAAEPAAEPAARPGSAQKKKKQKKAGQGKAQARAAEQPTDSEVSWDDDAAADPDFTESKLRAGGRGSKGSKAKKQPAAAAAEPAAAPASGGRPQRERKQAGAFWLGGSDGTAASAEREEAASGSDSEQEEPGQQQQQQPARPQQLQQLTKRSPPEAPAAAGAEEGTRSGKKRRKPSTGEEQEVGAAWLHAAVLVSYVCPPSVNPGICTLLHACCPVSPKHAFTPGFVSCLACRRRRTRQSLPSAPSRCATAMHVCFGRVHLHRGTDEVDQSST